jgi:hypothetical protein
MLPLSYHARWCSVLRIVIVIVERPGYGPS